MNEGTYPGGDLHWCERYQNKQEVWDLLSSDEILAQLAEECSELAQAALKLRRAKTKINPTPITEEKAFDNLLEEIADVQVCLKALNLSKQNYYDMYDMQAKKYDRWMKRLNFTS